MDDFSQYQPERWLTDGLLINRKYAVRASRVLRKVKDTISQSALIVTTCAAIISTNLPISGSGESFSTAEGDRYSIASVENSISSFGTIEAADSTNQVFQDVDDEVVMGKFLAFLDHHIEHKSELIVPADQAQIQRINELLAGV